MTVWLLAAGLVVLLVPALFALSDHRRKTRRMRSFAQERGWRYTAVDLPASRSRLQVTRETGMSRLVSRRDLRLESEQFNDTFRFAGSRPLTWRPAGITPRRAEPLLGYACDVLDRVPSFVWKAA